MLTIKRQISAASVTRELIHATIIEHGYNSQTTADKIFALFNPEPQYETVILQIGQRVKIVGGMIYDRPEPGTVCKVVRIEITNEGIEVAVKDEDVDDDYNEFKVKAEQQDVSRYIQLI